MQSRLYIVLAALFAVGCIVLASYMEVPLRQVQYREAGTDTLSFRSLDSSVTGQKIVLSATDSLHHILDGHWFWQVEHGDTLFQEIYDLPQPPFLAPFSGAYVFTAYVDLRRVAVDTLIFVEGERIGVEWPPAGSLVGDRIHFADRSTRVNKRRWFLFHGRDTLDRGFDKEFQWVPKKAGEYRIEVQLQSNSGRDTVLTHDFEVSAKPPEKSIYVPESKKKPDPKPRSDPKPKKVPPVYIPPERPVPLPKPVPPPRKGECFSSAFEPMARAGVVKVPIVAPKRDDVKGSDSGTVFDVVPSRDCQFASFEWWGDNNVNSGDATVTIACLDQCNGRPIKKDDFQISADYYDPSKREFSFRTAPVLRANARYRITIKSDHGAKMGHFSLPQTSYKQDGFELIFSKPESGVFNLTFRVK